jgi:hypothetical protein
VHAQAARLVSLAQPTYIGVTFVENQHTLGDANESATGRDGNEGPGEEEAMAARAEMATLGVALAEANTDSELLEHVREYETAMQECTREEWEVAMEILGIFWSDSGPAATAKLKELMGVGAPPE